MILVDVQTGPLQAFPGHARDFAQAVIVRGLDAEPGLDFLTRLLGPGFGAEQAEAQAERGLVDIQLIQGVGQVQGVTRVQTRAVVR
jgi:hypothetical protein